MADQKPALVSRDFLRFQQNLRSTAFGIRFAKKLFVDPGTLSAKQITQALKLLGLNIPKEVEVAADIAQAYAVGSVLVDSLESYENVKNAENFRNVTNATAASMKVASNLLEHMGLMDENTASMVQVGGSIVQIYASGGADIGSWMSLGLELGMQSEKAKAQAAQLAQKNAIEWYKGQISNQASALETHLKSLNSGDIGVFEFLSQAADDAHLLFENAVIKNPVLQKVFPNLKFFPVMNWNAQFDASVTTWYGDTKSDSFTLNLRTIGDMNENQAREFIFGFLFKPYLEMYLNADRFFQDKGKASLIESASIACLDGDGYFDKSDDFSSKLKKHLLSPSELGDKKTFSEMPNFIKQSGVSIFQEKTFTRDQALILDEKGMIESLVSDKTTKRYLSQRFTYDSNPAGTTFTNHIKSDWREAQNFVACLDLLDMVRNEPQFVQTAEKHFGPKAIDMFPQSEIFKKKMHNTYNLSMVKKINTIAMSNVGYFLETDPKKLVKINGSDVGPGIFRVKK